MSTMMSTYVLHTLSCKLQSCKQLPSQTRFLNRWQIPLRSLHTGSPGTSVQQEGLWEGTQVPSTLLPQTAPGAAAILTHHSTSISGTVLLRSTCHALSQAFGTGRAALMGKLWEKPAEPGENHCFDHCSRSTHAAAFTEGLMALQGGTKLHCKRGKFNNSSKTST